MKKYVFIVVVATLCALLVLGLIQKEKETPWEVSVITTLGFWFAVIAFLSFMENENFAEIYIKKAWINRVLFSVAFLAWVVILSFGSLSFLGIYGKAVFLIDVICLGYIVLYILIFWNPQRVPENTIAVKGTKIHYTGERLWMFSFLLERTTFILKDEGLPLPKIQHTIQTGEGAFDLWITSSVIIKEGRGGGVGVIKSREINLRHIKKIVVEKIKRRIRGLDLSDKTIGEAIDLLRGIGISTFQTTSLPLLWVGQDAKITIEPQP